MRESGCSGEDEDKAPIQFGVTASRGAALALSTKWGGGEERAAVPDVSLGWSRRGETEGLGEEKQQGKKKEGKQRTEGCGLY